MKILKHRAKAIFVCAATTLAAACATNGGEDVGDGEPQWAANGWLTPGMSDEPEIIGLYLTRKACEAGLDEWLSRQVVGNPIHGECLPIDRH